MTHVQEIEVWQDVYSGGNLPLGFQFLISLHPAIENQVQNKGQCPEFLFYIKA